MTGNFRVPLSPMRFTVGAFSNGNELTMVNQPFNGPTIDIGGSSFTPADVGTLTSKTSFASTAPYVGVGFDFEVFGKAGINLDFGVLWQGDPSVSMQSDGLAASLPAFQAALEAERLQLEDDMSDFKAGLSSRWGLSTTFSQPRLSSQLTKLFPLAGTSYEGWRAGIFLRADAAISGSPLRFLSPVIARPADPSRSPYSHRCRGSRS